MTRKEKMFIDILLSEKNWNYAEAAIKAGYTKSTARAKAASWLKPGSKHFKPELYNYCFEKMKEIEAKLDKKSQDVIQELWCIVDTNILEFFNFHYEVDENSPNKDRKMVMELKPLDQIDGKLLKELRATKFGYIVKTHDKMQALTALGRHYGLFDKKDEIEKMTIEIKDYRGTDNI